MTREKVIEGLKHCSEDGCKGCPYEQDCKMCDGFSDLAKDALELLKEQEPVEPDKPEEVWLCGNCGEIVGWDDWVISTDDVRYNYCPGCGRRVKWDANDRCRQTDTIPE